MGRLCTLARIGGWTAALLLLAPVVTALDSEPFVLVPEMKDPPGILYQSAAERGALRDELASSQAIDRLAERARALWPRIRQVDLIELSRFQVEATRGWRLPAEPGAFRGEVIARDGDGRLHVELRGPRLPTRFDVVFRYLYLYGVYDPASGSVDRLVVTIRGWVEE